MCGRFISLSYDEVAGMLSALIGNAPYLAQPDWLTRREVFPGTRVPLIARHGDAVIVEECPWGFPVPWMKPLLHNARLDKACQSDSIWASPMENGRAVVPVAGFYEPHKDETYSRSKSGRMLRRQYLFTEPSADILLLGALVENGRFSIVTTEPNESVAHIHHRMPLVLSFDEARRWLAGEADFADRSAIELNASSNDPVAANQLSIFLRASLKPFFRTGFRACGRNRSAGAVRRPYGFPHPAQQHGTARPCH